MSSFVGRTKGYGSLARVQYVSPEPRTTLVLGHTPARCLSHAYGPPIAIHSPPANNPQLPEDQHRL